MSLFSFVFVDHFGLACGAALLFLVGVLLAFPVVKHGSTRLTWLPLILFRMVRRMLGTRPGMTRLWSLIFGFNGTVMLLYMASGVRPGIPATLHVIRVSGLLDGKPVWKIELPPSGVFVPKE